MTTLKNQTIDLQCDSEPKELWEKCLALHLVRAGVGISPNCALAMIAGVSHEEADEALDDMRRRLKAARITITGDQEPARGDHGIHIHRDIIQ